MLLSGGLLNETECESVLTQLDVNTISNVVNSTPVLTGVGENTVKKKKKKVIL